MALPDNSSDTYLANMLRLAVDSLHQGDGDPLAVIDHVIDTLEARNGTATID